MHNKQAWLQVGLTRQYHGNDDKLVARWSLASFRCSFYWVWPTDPCEGQSDR